jgi:glycosyltransferase involved in cell wall biosynthesis
MVTGAYWPELSGGGLQCRTMIQALRDRYQFEVLTTCTDQTLPTRSEVDGTRVTRVYVDLSRPTTKVRAALSTVGFFRRHRRRFDVVHLHGFSQKSVLIVMLARLLGKKLVLTLHTAEHDEAAAVRRRGWLPYWAYRQMHLYLAISSRMAHNYLAAGLPKTRLRLAPNGVDAARFNPPKRAERDAARRELGPLPEGLYWILFVGFFSRDKAPDVLFEAWVRLLSLGVPPCGLLFVGATESEYPEVDSGLAREIAARAAQLGLADRVRFTGPLANVERAYHAADLFVMPSSREAFGMVLVEAMASAVPVVATEIKGVTDEIVATRHTGILVPAGDPEALAGALGELLLNIAAARAMGARARESVVSTYSLDAARRRWSDAYDSLK